MNIFDEKFYDFKMNNNKIIIEKTFKFNIKEFENIIKKIPYTGQRMVKDNLVENTAIPSMCKVFCEEIFFNQIPTPETFFSNYISAHFNIINDEQAVLRGTNTVLRLNGLKGRVFRAYPSLLRDYHFYALCCESGKFEEVKYSFLTDTQKGVDLILKYKGVDFAISLYVNTRRSKSYKKKKYQRHDYSKMHEVCVEINPFDKRNYIGDYALYNNMHLNNLITEMDNIILGNSVSDNNI